MRVIPVIDLLDSIVVRGVAGQREQYRPIESNIVDSADPLDVARAFRHTFGFTTIYVADLDAILRSEPNIDIYQQLTEDGFDILVDAGLRNAFDVESILMAGATKVIVGLETWPSLATLEMTLHRFGAERIIFSLDLSSGKPVRKLNDVLSDDPADIGCAVIEAGVREMIVLDLASVGISSGPTTLEICQALRDFAPKLSLITGGGIRSANDLQTLREAEINGALVASALHSGAITALDL